MDKHRLFRRPVKSISYEDAFRCGAYGTITIVLKNGWTRELNFEELEGNMLL